MNRHLVVATGTLLALTACASPSHLWRARAQCIVAVDGDGARPCRRPASAGFCGEQRRTLPSCRVALSVGHAAELPDLPQSDAHPRLHQRSRHREENPRPHRRIQPATTHRARVGHRCERRRRNRRRTILSGVRQAIPHRRSDSTSASPGRWRECSRLSLESDRRRSLSRYQAVLGVRFSRPFCKSQRMPGRATIEGYTRRQRYSPACPLDFVSFPSKAGGGIRRMDAAS